VGLEEALAAVLAEVLGVPGVAHDQHFFDGLGADSMLMAKFCARVRKRSDLPRVSIKDIYRYPTIGELAAALAGAGAPTAALGPQKAPEIQTPDSAQSAAAGGPARGASRAQFVGCALVQLLVLITPLYAAGLLGGLGYRMIRPGAGVVDLWLRAAGFSAVVLAGAFGLPIALKWLLIGRFRDEEIPVWTPRYVRFWIVKLAITRTPVLPLLVGSPLYPIYLRALGARVGRGTTILTRRVPVCTDLLTIGARTVIRRDAVLLGYHAHDRVIRTGRVTLGAGVVVGAHAVLDIDTAIGDRGQLGHASALHPGQTVPPGERWHGSPAGPGASDFTEVPPARCEPTRRVRFGTWQLFSAVFITGPLALAAAVGLSVVARDLVGVDGWGRGSLTDPTFYGRAAGAAFVLLAGVALIGPPLLFAFSRVLSRLVRPGEIYPLFGVRYLAHRAITRATNYKFFTQLCGDSSLIVHYLLRLGYRLRPYRQTGTNFGLLFRHETPFAVSVGTGTVIADGLVVVNAEYSASSFRVRPARIGAENFLGNYVIYPSASRVGDDCLLATKVMVPTDGQMRAGVGLLGSPSFEIPRTVARDHDLAITDPDGLRRGLGAKNRHNAVSIGLFLAVRWVYLLAVLVLAQAAGELYRSGGAVLGALMTVAIAVAGLAWFVFVERAVAPLCTLRPSGVSIYDRAFWRHERFWKLPSHSWPQLFNGTPYKVWIWRALGARFGRGVFDDGVSIVEKTFVAIGDGVTLNVGSIIQAHSQEDGAFKSDRITISSGVNLGVSSFVHYGVSLGQNAYLGADSFLMKGEDVPADAVWGGNPAREMALVGRGGTS